MEAGQWWTDYSLMRKRGLEAQEGTLCQVVCASMIMLNAIVIGLETDFPEWTGWSYVENSFLVFFTCELTVRLILYTPRKYFSYSAENPDMVWNVFDFLIVTFGLVDMVSTFVAPDCSSMKFATIFRMIRLLRILRIIRIIRFLKQLYLLAYGFVEAALAIVWVTVLMTFVLYICSIVIVRLYGHTKRSGTDADFLRENFGTVPVCMLSLFKLMSNPDLGPYHSVIDCNPSLLPFFVGFIIFGSFGMIALLTGVISESMFEKNKARIEEERLERETKRARFQRECQLLFDSMDQDQTGSVSHDEIMEHKEEVAALLEDAGIKIGELELKSLCHALDFDADGGVDRVEFENGVIQMCEEIRPQSIMELHHSIRKCHMLVESQMSQLMCRIESVDGMVNDINKHLGLSPAIGTPAEGFGSAPVSGRCNELTRKRSSSARPSPRPSPRFSPQPSTRVQRLEVPRPQQWSVTVAGKDGVELTRKNSCQSDTDAVKMGASLAGTKESKGPSTAKDSLLQGFQHHLQELSVLGAELQRVVVESTLSWQPTEVSQNNVQELGSLTGLRAEAEKTHDPDPAQVPDFVQMELALRSASSHKCSAKGDSLGDDFLDGSCAAAVNIENESTGSSANANVDVTAVENEPGETGLLDGSVANVDATVQDSGGAVLPGSAPASARQSLQSTVHSSDVECDKGIASFPGS